LPGVFADITDRGYRGLVKPVRILGGLLAAGGGVALVTAMTAMERIGDCGNGYDPPCPPGIENDFFLMAGAVMAVAVGSIMTWGVGLAVAVVAAGVAALVYSQTVPTNLRIVEFVTAAVCFGLLALGIAIGWAAFRGAAAKRRAIEEQIAEEARFKQRATMVAATVAALRDTGTTVGRARSSQSTCSSRPGYGGLECVRRDTDHATAGTELLSPGRARG
jgi:hypothetical protein